MRISLIVAASTNDVIGVQGGLPWHIPEDLRRFKALTLGKPIVMGRLTYESIGRPLPERRNIVMTRRADYAAAGCTVVADAAAALAAAGDADEVMIIGGGDVYRQFLPSAERIHLTRVHTEVDGDTYFPALDVAQWQRSAAEHLPADASRRPAVTFETWERIEGSRPRGHS